MSELLLDNQRFKFEGTIESFFIQQGKNPDSYLFMIDGKPVPMDMIPGDSETVRAVRVASGG